MAKLCPNLKRLGTTSVGFAALSHFPGHSTRIWGKGFFQKLEQVNRASKAVLAVALASLSINFLWTPIFAWGLGAVFLSDLPDLWVGLLMLMVTPCTDWYLVFTGIAGGNVVLATALLPVNLVLQVLLLPVYLLLLAGDLVELNVEILLSGLFWILFLPLLAAALTQYSIRQIKTERGERGSLESYQDRISIMQIVALNLAIVFIFATEGSILAENPALLFKLLPPILVFFRRQLPLGLPGQPLAGFGL
ncbi:arsenic resistance protein [Thermostichus sp. OS-CIW-26]|jgi:ACR3 family arsenite efflux pump ArsB